MQKTGDVLATAQAIEPAAETRIDARKTFLWDSVAYILPNVNSDAPFAARLPCPRALLVLRLE